MEKHCRVIESKINQVCLKGYELGPDTKNYQFHTELEPILSTSDVVLTDSLPRDVKTESYINKYQVTLERMKLTNREAILNPCPPFFRNEEVSSNVITSEYFVGYEFKKNLLFVQQAIILFCLGIKIKALWSPMWINLGSKVVIMNLMMTTIFIHPYFINRTHYIFKIGFKRINKVDIYPIGYYDVVKAYGGVNVHAIWW